MDWTEMGAPPPIATLPIFICLVFRRMKSSRAEKCLQVSLVIN